MTPASRISRAVTVGVAVVLAVSACGSTLQRGAAQPPSEALGGGLAAPEEGEFTALPGTSLSPQVGGGTSAGTSGGASVPVGGEDRPAGTSSLEPSARSTAPAAVVPGVTATTIKFGAAYTTDSGQANTMNAGAPGLDEGDARQYYNALIKQINSSGGIAGRKLVASYFETQSTSTASADSVEQAACEKWTRDDPVFVTLGGASVGLSELFRDCAERAGLVHLYSGASNSIDSTFRRHPHYVEASSLALDRAGRATAEGLARTDYFGSKPVIGVVAWDHPNYRSAVERHLTPTLGRLGYAVKETAYIKVSESNAGVADSSAAASNAVLRFRDSGVDHVLIMDGPAGVFGGTGLTLLFVKAAGSQLYYPRYGLNDSNSPESGLQAGLWTADDMRGARVVSWTNVLDESDHGTTPNAQRKACLDLMQREGVSITNLNARGAALRACDYIWLLKATLGTAPAAVSRDIFIHAVNRLGTTYSSPITYGTSFSTTQHDGVGKLRLMKLDDACDCFVYTSAPYAAPGR